MFTDYYAILEIVGPATKAEIKSAYKKAAVKWHPDKNHGVDTTKQMQEINEAYLILNDDDARSRYDREYIKFNKFREEKKKEEPKQEHYEQKKQEQERATENKSYEKKTEKPKEEYTTYQFDDELLKKWMENAKKQAIRNVHEMVIEFRDSSVIGFGTFFKTALMAIAVGAIFFIIVLIIKSISK
ncbi:MAG: DnaJ domain-containing protein [Bacteroidota bacterium]|nr:DnaJ domain-containing protein [Bacteroidota bacterium]